MIKVGGLLVLLGMGLGCQVQEAKLAQAPQPNLDHLSQPKRGELATAVAKIQNLDAKDTDSSGQAWGELAQVFHAFDLRMSAITCYRQAIVFQENNGRWHYLLGLLLQEVAQPEAAIPHFEMVALLEPNYIPNLLALADGQFRQNVYDSATQLFQRVLALDSQQVVAQAGLAAIALERRQFANALDWAEKGLTNHPNVARLNYLAAMALRNLGQTETSAEYFARSQKRKDKLPLQDLYFDNIQALAKRDQILIEDGLQAETALQFEKAEALFIQASAWQPKSAKAIYQLGRLHHRLGLYQKALETLNRAVEIGPKSALIHYQRGNTLSVLGQIDQAEKAFQKAIDLDPETLLFHISAGDFARKNRKFEVAKTIYTLGLKHHPNDWHLHMGSLLCQIWLNHHLQAKSRLESLIAKPQTPSPFLLLLARLLAASPNDQVRNGQRAMALVEGLMKQSVNTDLLETGAMAMAEMGDFKKAIDWQNAAIELVRKSLQRGKSAQLRKRLNLYRQNRACRVPFEPDADLFTNPLS